MSRRNGFTLVELVVVVMILGILVAVAAPRLINTSGTATDNGVRQTLSVVRGAIERYAAENAGALPSSSIATELRPYVRGTFPKCPVGAKKGENGVLVSVVDPLVAEGTPTQAWMYNVTTGEFIINSTATSNDGTTVYEDF